MSTGYGEGDNRVSMAIQNAQHSPLLNNNDIFNSKKVLLNISYSSQYKLMMSEMDEVKEFMNRFSRDFETKFGMAVDDKLEQKVKITLLATGFGIQDIHMKEMDDRITQRTAEEQKRLAELEEEEEQRRSRRETYYGKDANTQVSASDAAGISISSTLKTWTTPTSSAWWRTPLPTNATRVPWRQSRSRRKKPAYSPPKKRRKRKAAATA